MEYARRCTVCGKIYCYTDQDLKNNKENAAVGAVSAIGAIASLFGGTAYHTFEFNKMSDRSLDKVIDYNKCPNCGSSSTVILSADELEKYKNNELDNTVSSPQPIAINTNATPDALVERGMLFLEDQEWDKANAYFENALDADPKNVRAYIGKLLVDLQLSKEELLVDYDTDFTDNPNYKKALRFSTEQEKEQLESINKDRIYKKAKEVSKTDLKGAIKLLDSIKDYKDAAQLIDSYSETIKSDIYETALSARESKSISQLAEAAGLLEELGDYREAKKLVDEYHSRIEEIEAEEERIQQEKREQKYEAAVSLYKKASNLQDYEKARTALQEMNGYKDCDNLVAESQKEINRLTEIKQQEEARAAIIKAKKKKRTIGIISAIAVVCVVSIIVINKVIIPNNKYNKAVSMMENGEYESALSSFEALGSYKDSQDKSKEAQKGIWYSKGVASFESGDYINAVDMFEKADSFLDSESKLTEAKTKLEEQKQKEIEATYLEALDLINNKDYESAYQMLSGIDGYKDVSSLLQNFYYIPYKIRQEFVLSNYWDYIFEFSDNGFLTKYTLEGSTGDIDTFNLEVDQNGVLLSKTEKFGEIHTFRYESDRVYETYVGYDGTDHIAGIYDQYGNIMKGRYKKELKLTLDEHNNIFLDNRSNVYDSEGNLIKVSVYTRVRQNSTFQYKLIYNNNAPENYEEILWRNIKLVCGEYVWQPFED